MRGNAMTFCEVRLPGCHGRAVHKHHRKLRSQGGDDSLFNTLAVCASCHQGVHQEPARAYLHGWMVKSWDDASRNPVIPWKPEGFDSLVDRLMAMDGLDRDEAETVATERLTKGTR